METLNRIMKKERENRVDLLKKLFSARLKEIREEKQLSQKNVADKLGCAVSTYANWEQGRTEPSIYDIFNLMWVYEIEANELFDVNSIT